MVVETVAGIAAAFPISFFDKRQPVLGLGWRTRNLPYYTVKKISDFPVPAGKSLNKLFLAGNRGQENL
jgi:hypothetical protein